MKTKVPVIGSAVFMTPPRYLWIRIKLIPSFSKVTSQLAQQIRPTANSKPDWLVTFEKLGLRINLNLFRNP